MDHIFGLNQLLQCAGEYKLPFCLLYVNYDCSELNAEIRAPEEE